MTRIPLRHLLGCHLVGRTSSWSLGNLKPATRTGLSSCQTCRTRSFDENSDANEFAPSGKMKFEIWFSLLFALVDELVLKFTPYHFTENQYKAVLSNILQSRRLMYLQINQIQLNWICAINIAGETSISALSRRISENFHVFVHRKSRKVTARRFERQCLFDLVRLCNSSSTIRMECHRPQTRVNDLVDQLRFPEGLFNCWVRRNNWKL